MNETARIISGEKKTLPINKNIQRVELQISKSVSNAQEESHFQNLNRNPKMWSKTRLGNVILEELFVEANRAASKDADLFTNNKDARKRYINVHGNCVAVSAQAGLGKTTLTKQLLEKVLEEKILEVDYVFYVSLKKVKFNRDIGVLQFLLTNLYSSWEHDISLDKAVLKALAASDKVMIIMDGLDEADVNYKDSCPTVTMDDVTTAETILKNLLDGHILPKAKKLITSRPRQLLELRENYRPDFTVDILGLNSDAQKQICQDICGSNSEKVYEYLSKHPELSAQCFVPIICIFTIYSLHQQQLNPNNSIAFASVTNIMLYVLENFVRLRVWRSETFELDKLAKLAWEGLRQKKYEFSEHDLQQLNLKKGSLDTVLTTGTNENTKLRLTLYGKVTYFSHLILQEFFSAAYLVLFASLQEFNEMLFSVNNQTNFEVVKKFLFGLCNPDTYKRLLTLNNSLNTNKIVSDLKEKNLSLTTFFSNVMNGPFFKAILYKLHLSSAYTIDFASYQIVCLWIYESQQKELTEEAAKLTPMNLLVSGNVFPHEVSSLCYVLRARLQPLTLKFEEPKFIGDSCERLLKEISDMQDHITVSIATSITKYILLNATC